MTKTEIRRAKKEVNNLNYIANVYQNNKLPPITTCKAKSAYQNGALLTDTFATWTKKKFVSGPFVFL